MAHSSAPPSPEPTPNGGGVKKPKATKPTPEQIEAKRLARAQKKQAEAKKEAERRSLLSGNASYLDEHGAPLYTPRRWAHVKASQPGARALKVVSWNILAQGLVRRTLFPVSDCLKFKDRCAGLTAELSSRTGHGWDVGCFQEVDRMEVHAETLERDGCSWIFEKGYQGKQHGLLVAWRKSLFGCQEEKRLVVDLDEEEIGEAQSGRKGCSRVTRNIGLFVALRFQKSAGEHPAKAPGIIAATTHLFWHPMHAYERARQSGILKRRLDEFRISMGSEWKQATVILAGDFNDEPHSATYHLLTGQKLSQHCIQELKDSMVVHKSIDEKETKANAEAPASGTATPVIQEGEDEEGGSDDRMLKNCRAATEADGLMKLKELIQLHDLSLPRPGSTHFSTNISNKLGLISSYDSAYGNLDPPESDNFFGSKSRGRERHDDEQWTPGSDNVHTGDSKEPMWTIFSGLFSLTLDYIFLLPDKENGGYPKVTRLLLTHRTQTLEPGVPRKGICASDHVAIGAEISV